MRFRFLFPVIVTLTYVLTTLQWIHTRAIAIPIQWWLDNVVTTAEESTKASIREIFSFFGRFINGMASMAVSVFIDRGFYRKQKGYVGNKRTEAWNTFWRGANSTLNAVIEQEGIIERTVPPSPTTFAMKRSGSELFDRPSGFGVSQTRMERRGLTETVKVWFELGVEVFFAAFRAVVQFIFLIKPSSLSPGLSYMYNRKKGAYQYLEDLSEWTSSDVILQSGYPLEEHVVTTSDGYILSMQRIPRRDSKEVVFFMHGVLDTSLGWVCNGPQGSQAFAAYDAGADVWLGNCRANPPRAHADAQKGSSSYWAYSINELAMEDITALVKRIDAVKRSENTSLSPPLKMQRFGSFSFSSESFSAPTSPTQREKEQGKRETPRFDLLFETRKRSFTKTLYKEPEPIFVPESEGRRKEQQLTPDRISFQGRERTHSEWDKHMSDQLEAWQRCLKPTEETESMSVFARTAPLDNSKSQPYTLKVVAHSLGAASMLIYAVMCRVLGQPHRISRMVLLTPAGFHHKYPSVAMPFLHILPVIMRFLNAFRPGVGAPAYIPSPLLRYVTFKLSTDLHHIPALNELTRAALRLLFNGDSSEWDRALQMPHYAVASMPALSVHTGAHLIQLIRRGKFELYDYGSSAVNQTRYGLAHPPNVSDHYDLLEGIKIDLVAGTYDGVISKEDVMRHYNAMRDAGVEVTYKELELGHLDMCYSSKEEVLQYVSKCLSLRV